jgi:hypothetical protein
MKQCCAEAVNVAANVLRLIVQSLRRHIGWCSPDHTIGLSGLRVLRGEGSKAEVANLCRLFVDK